MSMIEFSCPSCNAQYRVPAKAGGKQATCKSCGKKITVPSAGGSEAGGSRGSSSGSSRNVDLSGLYHSAEAGGQGPVMASPMQEGSIFATSSPKRSGPSPALLIGVGGGAVILILAVVLLVVLMGGGGDAPAPGATPGTGPSVVESRPMRPRGGGAQDDADTTPPNEDTDSGESTTPAPVNVPQGRLIDPPDAALAGVMDWSLPVPEKVATYAERFELRGIVLSLPPDWQAQAEEVEAMLQARPRLRDALVQALGEEVSQAVVLKASPADPAVDADFYLAISLDPEPRAWPTFRSVDAVSPASLGLQGIDPGEVRDAARDSDPGAAAGFGVFDTMTNQFEAQGLAFNPLKPDAYYLKEGAYDAVTYGTLLGGHPFARAVLRPTTGDTQTLLYVGTVGHMQIAMLGQASTQNSTLLDDLDWIIRSARLMTPTQAREYARRDTVYDRWINSAFIDVAYAGDNPPHAGLDKPGWDGFSDRSLFQNAAAAARVTPYRQPYGLIAPEGLRLATTNRVAARWSPDENGLWLQMKVTKLEGLDQRSMTSPILPAQGDVGPRLFIYSNPADLPAGYEHSEVQADGLTLHRVLLPAVQGQSLRKVYYILFDGPDQVTIEGRYDPTRPQDLEQLDAAAQTLTKI